MSQGLVVQGANPAALFPQGVTLSQRALAVMQARSGPSELGQGITGGFGVVSYKGKVWHIKHGGEDTIIKQRDPHTGMESPVQYIEVVIVAAAPHLTKTWYEQQYVEGSNAAPDCTSSDGVRPEAASPKRQADLCATCRWNQYGSRVSADGRGRGKACQDNKRLAVVPYADLENESNGGPMLLRIPPASLQNLQKFAGLMERNGYPFYGVSVYLFFVGEEAYPQIDFKPARPLSDDEFSFIEGLRLDDRTARVLNSSDAVALPAPAPQPEQPLFGGPPGQQTINAAQQPAPQPAVHVTQPAPQPAPMNTGPAPAPIPPTPQQMPPVTPVTPAPAPQAAPSVAQAAPVAAPPVQPAPAPQPQPAPVQTAPIASEGQSVSAAPAGEANINDFLDNLGGM